MEGSATLPSGMPTTTMLINSTTGVGALSYDNSKEVSFRYFGISIALFTIVIGGIGNLLTILAFVSNRKLRTTFNIFIVNLSLVDFITATLMMPFHLASYVQMQWPFGNYSITARLQAFSYFSCGYTSIVFLIAITVNRFVGVVRPGQYNEIFRRNRLIITLVICWTFAPVCLFPFLVGTDPKCVRPQTPDGPLIGFNSRQFLSTFVCLPKNGWNTYMQVTRIVFQFLPLAVMVTLYGYIFVSIKRKSQKVVKSMTKSRIAPSLQAALSVGTFSSVKRTNSGGAAPSPAQRRSVDSRRASEISRKNIFIRKMSSQSVISSRRTKSESRLLLISVAICVGFMITFLPSVIINLLPGKSGFDPRIHMMASNLSWFNASLNPIIYVILNRRFRKEYVRIVKMAFGQVKGSFVRDVSSTLPEKGPTQRSHSLSGNASSQLLVKEGGKISDSAVHDQAC